MYMICEDSRNEANEDSNKRKVCCTSESYNSSISLFRHFASAHGANVSLVVSKQKVTKKFVKSQETHPRRFLYIFYYTYLTKLHHCFSEICVKIFLNYYAARRFRLTIESITSAKNIAGHFCAPIPRRSETRD